MQSSHPSISVPIHILDFVGCLFFDLTVLYAFGNTLFIGANVLQLGGVLTFTGCTFLENTVFGVENGLGLVSAGLWEERGIISCCIHSFALTLFLSIIFAYFLSLPSS